MSTISTDTVTVTLDAETIIVGPNDVIVLRVPDGTTPELAASFGAIAARVLGPGRTLVVGAGVEVLVARDARTEGNDHAH